MKHFFKKLSKFRRGFLALFLTSNLILLSTGSAELNTSTDSANLNNATDSANLSIERTPAVSNIVHTPVTDPSGKFYENQISVKFKDGVSPESKLAVVEANNAAIIQELPYTGITVLKVDPARRESILASLASDPNVERVKRNYIMRALEGGGGGGGGGSSCITNDYYYCYDQLASWGLRKIQAPEAWNIRKGDPSKYIAVLDTGIDYNHYDLGLATNGGRVVKGWDFFNPFEYPNDPMDDSSNSHGTIVSGILGAKTNNYNGMAAVDWYAKIVAIKVLGPNGLGPTDFGAEGIRFAVDNYPNLKVINMSVGQTQVDDPDLKNAVKYAQDHGVYVVAGTANSQSGVTNCFMGFPAAYTAVISVVATNQSDGHASGCTGNVFNNKVYQRVQITAPGEMIFSLQRNNVIGYVYEWTPGGGGYVIAAGTSLATPYVSGVLSVLASCSSIPSIDLVLGADDRGPVGWDSTYGFGRLNMYKSLQRARNRGDC